MSPLSQLRHGGRNLSQHVFPERKARDSGEGTNQAYQWRLLDSAWIAAGLNGTEVSLSGERYTDLLLWLAKQHD